MIKAEINEIENRIEKIKNKERADSLKIIKLTKLLKKTKGVDTNCKYQE